MHSSSTLHDRAGRGERRLRGRRTRGTFARAFVVAALLVASLGVAGRAAADDTSPKRQLPDYDGRGPKPTTTGDVLLWIPRVLLAPPYFVSEYLVRRPLGFVITAAERAGVPAALYDFFAFGPDHKAGFVPTAYAEFGFEPSVGLYVFWDDAFVKGHDLRLHGGTAGKDWLSLAFTERFRIGPQERDTLSLDAFGLERPDYAFFGLGPRARQSSRVRYGQDTLEASATVDRQGFRSSLFRGRVRLRSVDFHPGGWEHDPRLDDAVAAGNVARPPGYPRGYTLVESALAYAFDTRRERPAPGSGVRLVGAAAYASDVRKRSSFVRYGGSLAGFLDLTRERRVLGLGLGARFVDPIARGDVPFTELVSLGGSEPMSGFVPGRLLGRSALAATVEYQWPIWIWLDGQMRGEVGNVFGPELAGFDLGLLRFSGSVGVTTTTSNNGLEILVGCGTETFESGGKLDSARLVLTTHGL